MDHQIEDLAALVHSRSKNKQGRYLIAIAGGPGSGKTTIATSLAQKLRESKPADEAVITIPMDGFHLPRSTLDGMPNKEEAYIRRGAPWTFDVAATLEFVHRLSTWANSTSHATPEECIYAPSFDHAVKDPTPNGVVIPPDASIVILEGLYLLLDEPGWSEIAPLVDLRILVTVDLMEARTRVAKRHVEAGIEPTLEDGFRRVDQNDYLNGEMIYEQSRGWDVKIESV